MKNGPPATGGPFAWAAMRPVSAARGQGFEGAADDEPLDLIGAFENLKDLGVADPLFDGVVAHVALAAEDLDGVDSDLHGDIGGVALRHGAFGLEVGDVGAGHPGGAPDHEAGGIDGHGHIGQHEGDALVLDDRAAELDAGFGVVEGVFVGGAGDADGVGADDGPGPLEGHEGAHSAGAGRAAGLCGCAELVLGRKEVSRLARELSAVPTEARRRIPGVGSNRADLLHAAAIVIDEVMDILGAPCLTVSGQGLREGLAWQAIRGESPVLPDVRAASIAGLALANGVDVISAEPTVLAAAALFDATRTLHGLPDADRSLLLDAARLAGIGMHIDYYNRDRHAEYLVHSGDLHGYAHREVVLLAALVRWADSGTPDLSPYRAIIQPDDTRRAAVLASLLGLARAIRRRTPSPIHDVHAVLEGDALRLQLTASAPIDVELYELENRRRRFEAILRCRLVVEHVTGS